MSIYFKKKAILLHFYAIEFLGFPPQMSVQIMTVWFNYFIRTFLENGISTYTCFPNNPKPQLLL